MTDGPIMDAVSEVFEADPFNPEYVPEDGWAPEDYPQLTVAPIPYTSSAHPRADPYISITSTGWLFLEVGNTRIAIPDEEEWEKLSHMVECMWNTWRRTHPGTPEQDAPLPSLEEFVERFTVGDNPPTSTPPTGVDDKGEPS